MPPIGSALRLELVRRPARSDFVTAAQALSTDVDGASGAGRVARAISRVRREPIPPRPNALDGKVRGLGDEGEKAGHGVVGHGIATSCLDGSPDLSGSHRTRHYRRQHSRSAPARPSPPGHRDRRPPWKGKCRSYDEVPVARVDALPGVGPRAAPRPRLPALTPRSLPHEWRHVAVSVALWACSPRALDL